jgi:very-short-patch-repair endonuclease
MLRSIRGKRFEVYVISRIIHLLDDPDIELITQQPVRLDDGKLALVDLYLPQFRLGVEIDERHHFSERSRDADRVRELAIVKVAYSDIRRIEVEEAGSLYALRQKVDDLVERIRALKAKAVADGTFRPFVYGHRYDAEHWRAAGSITTDDDIQMHSMVDVCALFGKSVRHWQRGVLPLTATHRVWMPGLTQEGLSSRSDWRNTLSRDGLTIVEEQLKEGTYAYDQSMRSIVFAKFKDPVFLTKYYRFLGVFEITAIEDLADKKRVTYTRVASEVDLSEYSKR